MFVCLSIIQSVTAEPETSAPSVWAVSVTGTAIYKSAKYRDREDRTSVHVAVPGTMHICWQCHLYAAYWKGTQHVGCI